KYICEECGIRAKKPSMLKKHIRTHTDVRPYHCTYCNFSFKTKGNLTKHMKSKAHSKK
uniref:HUMAN ENHANCER-BINDING PROTEIN MBP-1 n=1 Tax=Homo sapiens TaxID=9606 RepID=UPI0001751721